MVKGRGVGKKEELVGGRVSSRGEGDGESEMVGEKTFDTL